MATINPSYPISSISGRYSATDRIHSRTNRTTGKTYGVALTRPNPQSTPTPAQQQSREAFRATWQKVDTILSDPAAHTYYTALWQAHTAACRHHRPLAQSAIAALPTIPTASLPDSSLLSSRRTPFSTPRTLLFHLLYHPL